ncbi:MAG: translation elongation factor Ts [Deltaproteobacteria bacterium RIFCSPLOWO2_02_FULL_47_10]|nr:MAG: translation elongation factor Ts [Deltaproteobacteria bacterium RIFCSPLOWO2_02_FULL_47_10]
MNITAETVKELRDRTGAGMMDCKRALGETGGDLEKAIDCLRRQGLAKAAKRAGRSASEGLVGSLVAKDSIIVTEVNCETDFVCKTDEFQKFSKEITAHVANTNPKDMDALLNSTMHGKKVKDLQTELIAKIGENLGVRRFVVKDISGKNVKHSQYIHPGSKIGVAVIFDDPDGKLTDEAGRNVAMHVAAMNPQFVRKSDVPEAVLAREKEVFLGQLASEKKPPQVLEKIVVGKLAKYLSEICLEDQIFVRDPAGKQTVQQMLTSAAPKVTIKEFIRYQVGEKA